MLVAAAFAWAAAAGAADLPSELATVAEVKFEGRRHVSTKELRAAVKTRTSDRLFSNERPLVRLDYLRADTAAIENVYHQHGYLDARATWRTQPFEPEKQAGMIRRMRGAAWVGSALAAWTTWVGLGLDR